MGWDSGLTGVGLGVLLQKQGRLQGNKGLGFGGIRENNPNTTYSRVPY